MAMTPEGKVQAYAITRLKEAGFLVRKMAYEGRHAAADLIAIGFITALIEVKKSGEVPRPSQQEEHDRIRRHGGLIFTVDCNSEVDGIVKILRYKNAMMRQAIYQGHV